MDDAWTGSKRKQTLIEVREAIGEEYQFKVVPPTRYIGINITMDLANSRYFLSQQHLIDKILTRFRMKEVFPRVTPADPKVKEERRQPQKQKSTPKHNYYLLRARVTANKKGQHGCYTKR